MSVHADSVYTATPISTSASCPTRLAPVYQLSLQPALMSWCASTWNANDVLRLELRVSWVCLSCLPCAVVCKLPLYPHYTVKKKAQMCSELKAWPQRFDKLLPRNGLPPISRTIVHSYSGTQIVQHHRELDRLAPNCWRTPPAYPGIVSGPQSVSVNQASSSYTSFHTPQPLSQRPGDYARLDELTFVTLIRRQM